VNIYSTGLIPETLQGGLPPPVTLTVLRVGLGFMGLEAPMPVLARSLPSWLKPVSRRILAEAPRVNLRMYFRGGDPLCGAAPAA
jgi:hypothetical protein